MVQEIPSVRLKGIGNSLYVSVAPDKPLEWVQSELARLFEPLKLTPDARVVLDTGSGGQADDRHRQICVYLKNAFNLNEVALPDQNRTVSENRFKMNNSRSTISHHGETLVMAGRIRSGQSVKAKKHLVIMGDVNPGCDLVAGGDIIVLGSLGGTAAAGQPSNIEAVIMAFDFRPTQVKIGAIVAAGLPDRGQGTPEIAHIENGTIVVDDYSSANPFKRIPWPVIR
jgi:septum site-determining protein MinC